MKKQFLHIKCKIKGTQPYITLVLNHMMTNHFMWHLSTVILLYIPSGISLKTKRGTKKSLIRMIMFMIMFYTYILTISYINAIGNQDFYP